MDVVVIGGGFGGLSAARKLARSGVRVLLCEALNYLGGCASTFSKTVRGGGLDGAKVRYETGATLFSGLGAGQRFATMIKDDQLDVQLSILDPVIEFRSPAGDFALRNDRHTFVQSMAGLPNAPRGVERFFRTQERVAGLLWEMLDEPALLPPFTPMMMMRHLPRLHRYGPLLNTVTKPLLSIMKAHGVDAFVPLRSVVQGLCQITVQTSLEQAEAPFALGAMDYPFRGTGHVVGGVGRLAEAIGNGLEQRGGVLWRAARATAVRRTDRGYEVTTRRGVVHAKQIIANLLPRDAAALVGVAPSSSVQRLSERIASGWSAVMLYGVARDEDLPAAAHHVEMVDDDHQPFVEGNHIFLSVSGRDDDHAPAGYRAFTVSTHVALSRVRSDDRAAVVEAIQARMRLVLSRWAPELAIVHMMTASPRTWHRFVARGEGAVGGAPRMAGWSSYAPLGPLQLSPAAPGVWLVGDSAFPGQSTLATTIGGEQVAAAVLRSLSSRGQRPLTS